ncbi:MAG: helical backbone metal receptor [Cyclobacteriaceae bacterium]
MANQSFVDQLGRTVEFTFPPKRIISLVPSQTELLFYMGLGNSLVGITKFCTHPVGEVQRITKVGGTKTVRFDLIDQLQPDLIIGNKEENEREAIARLAEKYPVWMSDINSFDDALSMMQAIGELTNRQHAAVILMNEIRNVFATLQQRSGQSALYLIWKSPWMAAGKNTFIDALLTKAGWLNTTIQERYPALTDAQIQAMTPEVVFLSSEPFPFAEKHIAELKLLLPNAKVMLVDGEMFSWYGNRMLLAPAYFNSLLV